MTIQLAYRQLCAQLYEIYEQREAANIADLVIEHVTGQRKIDRIVYKDLPVNENQQKHLEKIVIQLLQHCPVQYVLGEAWFMNLKLQVNESVLIPRPETEELAAWIIEDSKHSVKDLSLLDIGSGSGCIPIAIKKKLPDTTICAIDVSDDALHTALLNSIEQNTLIDFLHIDFLNEEEWKQLGKYDIIVSNPPYVSLHEEAAMKNNVRQHEPHLALFVPDNNALIFYQEIAKFSQKHLKRDGSIYVEINEAFGKQVVELFEKYGFKNIMLKKDMQGKDRMVRVLSA